MSGALASGVLGLELADFDHLQLAVLHARRALHPEAHRAAAGAGGGRALGLAVADENVDRYQVAS